MISKIFKIIKKRRKRRRLHFVLDISLSILILLLIVSIFTFNLYNPVVTEPEITVPDIPHEPIVINDPLDIVFNYSSQAIKANSFTTLNLSFINTSDEEIDKIKISFEILSSGFSLSRLQSDKLSDDMEIVANNLVIENILPEKTYNFSLKAYFSLPSDPLHRQCAWRGVVDIYFKDERFKQEQVLDNVYFLSDTSVSASAYYHSIRGDQLGIGPIPPIVSIPSSYWIFFNVENLGNDLKDFVISGRLPDYASLKENKTLLAGNYSFNEENKRLIWQVPVIDKSGGAYRAGFQIEIIPSSEHVGKVLNIIEDLRYRFYDDASYLERSGSLPNLDTNLKDDFINQGQGSVLE